LKSNSKLLYKKESLTSISGGGFNEEGIVKGVEFHGGCDGNLQAISRLVEGMKVEEAVDKMRSILCGGKSTSCADQLAVALEAGLIMVRT